MLGEPRISTALTSQLLAGDVVTVLEENGLWLRVRSVDNYEGWVHSGYVTITTGSEGTWRWSLGCRVRRADGVLRALPLGARVEPAAEVVEGEAMDAHDRSTRFPKTAEAIASSAERLFAGAPYQWGGVSPWGVDCSGLVQRVFALHGVPLPRDAWQQALVGTPTSLAAADAHCASDLLFFSDREDQRVTHVGVALDGARMVHSSLARGGVAIESMPLGDDYTARLRAQCVGVRRVV